LELFVRGVIDISRRELHQLEGLPAAIDKRQLLLIRGRCDDKNYFRKQKAAIHHFLDVEFSSLVWGASCLPKDEYEKWLETVKCNFRKPLGGLFLKWVARHKTKLISKLKRAIVDHPD
jgi:histidinol phosphatase-like enzyme